MSEYIISFDGSENLASALALAIASAGLKPLHEEIVRCRDCRYLCDDGSTWGCGWHCSCLTTNDGTPPDGFCAWGERRTE